MSSNPPRLDHNATLGFGDAPGPGATATTHAFIGGRNERVLGTS